MFSKFSRIGTHSAINALKKPKPKSKRNICCPGFTEVENDVFLVQGCSEDAGGLGVRTHPLPTGSPPGKETDQEPVQQTEVG